MHIDLIIGIYCNDYLQIAQVPYMDVRFQFEFCNVDARVSSRVKLRLICGECQCSQFSELQSAWLAICYCME